MFRTLEHKRIDSFHASDCTFKVYRPSYLTVSRWVCAGLDALRWAWDTQADGLATGSAGESRGQLEAKAFRHLTEPPVFRANSICDSSQPSRPERHIRGHRVRRTERLR